MLRAGIATGASLAATLVLAIHPITFEPVLWLAESYGYVLGNLLTLLAVWAYLEYERRSKVGWLWVALLSSLAAVLGIEQYLFVLGVLAVIHLLGSRWHRTARLPWLPLLIVGCCGLVFLLQHFVLFFGTAERLARATGELRHLAEPGLFWKLAWWLSLVPEASPYGGLFRAGWAILAGHGWLIALLALAALGAAWRMAAASSWQDAAGNSLPSRHLWLAATGMAVFSAALLPFLFTGKYGLASRNMYVALPGLVVAVAAALDLLAASKVLHGTLRFLLVPVVAAFVAVSLVIDIGAQAMFAESWRFHQDVMHAIKADAEAIRAAGAVEMTGIPRIPYQSISQIDNAWAFPCLVRWVVGNGDVHAWNNLMRPDDRHYHPSTRIIHWDTR